MDDTMWCFDSKNDLPVFAANLQRAGILTNLFSSGRKQLLVVASYDGLQLAFHPLAVLKGASRMLVHQRPGYIRAVGRHLLPHTTKWIRQNYSVLATKPPRRWP